MAHGSEQYLSEPFSVHRVVRFPQISEAHTQRDFPLSSKFLQSAHHINHVDCRSCLANTALVLGEYSHGLVIVSDTACACFEENFAGMRYKGNSSVVAAVGMTLLFAQHFDRGILLLLSYHTSPFHHAATIMLWKCRKVFELSSFSNSTGGESDPAAFSFPML